MTSPFLVLQQLLLEFLIYFCTINDASRAAAL